MWWWNYGFGWFFPVIWLLFWLFIVVLVIALFRSRWHRWGYYHEHGPYWQGGKSPEDLLAERFARGEIDEEEYNKRMEILKRRTR